MSFNTVLECGNKAIACKVIEEATKDMCIDGGNSMIKDVQDYIELLRSADYSPTDEFNNHINENLGLYLNNSSKYFMTFLGEVKSVDSTELTDGDLADAMEAGLEKVEEGQTNGLGKVAALHPNFLKADLNHNSNVGIHQRAKVTGENPSFIKAIQKHGEKVWANSKYAK